MEFLQIGQLLRPRFAIGFVTLLLMARGATGQPPKPAPAKNAARRQHLTFTGKPDDPQGLELWGPGAEDFVRFEEAGLRITLPGGRKQPSMVGVALSEPIQSNFDISMGYQI